MEVNGLGGLDRRYPLRRCQSEGVIGFPDGELPCWSTGLDGLLEGFKYPAVGLDMFVELVSGKELLHAPFKREQDFGRQPNACSIICVE